MPYASAYEAIEPRREDLDATPGPVVVEFGTPWCGYCRAAQPRIAAALQSRPEIRHIKVEDASGRRLGRSFAVKLWPTLVFLRDGALVATVVRPAGEAEIAAALARIDPR